LPGSPGCQELYLRSQLTPWLSRRYHQLNIENQTSINGVPEGLERDSYHRDRGGSCSSGTITTVGIQKDTDLKTALVERNDFSSGTSSRSTKLIHGGVRYLQKAIMKLDYEQVNGLFFRCCLTVGSLCDHIALFSHIVDIYHRKE
uniref:glycerol-3-phosphate dehydrogenase n=1 Tax=Hucho hucho TaxID=62062 RepID=A0A4W5KX86_9TELE